MFNPKIVTDVSTLRKPSSNIDDVKECKSIIEKLETALSKVNGVGLSAVQIGIHKKVSIIKRIGRSGEEMVHLINTELVETEEEFVFNNEGCLSLNQKPAKCKRFKHVIIDNDKIVDDHFEKERLYFWYSDDPDDVNTDGITAIAVQHELDHFQGVIITDRSPYEVNSSGDSFEKAVDEVAKPSKNTASKIGRNDPCPCGKKKSNGNPVKYKKCCYTEDLINLQ